jgi:hypothetical protein
MVGNPLSGFVVSLLDDRSDPGFSNKMIGQRTMMADAWPLIEKRH